MNQQQMEHFLGLSAGYLSKVRHGKAEPSQLLRVAVRLAEMATGGVKCPCGGTCVPVPRCVVCDETWIGPVEAAVFEAAKSNGGAP